MNAIIFLAFLTFVLFSNSAFAAEGSGGGLPYESWLGKLRDSLTGPVAFAVSIIGIIVAGSVLIFGGDMNGFFRTLVFLVLVMALIVGANNMMATFFGRGADLSGVSVIDYFNELFGN
ncbi:MAG: TrbC/VirB2 family protein [Gilliamella sp.]|nr:TrbC/VirB2 family protein [Gilliamella sp.]